MGFNNGKERRKFEDEWKKLRQQYRDAGFSEQGIDAMRAFDEDAYRSRRRFEEHTQPFPEEDFRVDGGGSKRSLFDKFTTLSTSFDESSFTGRFAWVDAVDNPALVTVLKRLNSDDLELLTLYAIEGHSQTEIALLLGFTKQYVSKRIRAIAEKLK